MFLLTASTLSLCSGCSERRWLTPLLRLGRRSEYSAHSLIETLGVSYGTILGATVAAMFPDRIGHMLLGGVLDAREYYNDTA